MYPILLSVRHNTTRQNKRSFRVERMSCGASGFSSPLFPNTHLSSASSTPLEDSNHLVMAKPTVTLPHYKWRLLIAYDGTHYAAYSSAPVLGVCCLVAWSKNQLVSILRASTKLVSSPQEENLDIGWQFQLSPATIQCIIENALVQIIKLKREDLHFVGASRTDTGVHAWGQVAHFITPFNYDSLEIIHGALNGLLPSDIRVREISAAMPEFHARFSAKSKVYHYKIYNDSIMDPFQRHYAYHSVYKLNAAAMREAAKKFIGKHDFSAFVNASRNDRVPNPVKTIFRFDVIEMGALLVLEVEGSGFLYRQVRNMVALLLQIGKEAIPPDIVPKILATRDRKELAKYALSAPPHGLCLVAVKYNEEHLLHPAGCPTTSFGRHHTVSKCKLPFY